MQNLSLFENNSQPFTASNILSCNLNDYTTLNLTKFYSLTETKSYAPITGCVLEHTLTTANLANPEKLYYLIADSLSIINKNKGGNRSCSLSGDDWAKRLGCSRSLVFTMQKSLVKKGYFIINKDFDIIGRNKRNLITPTLPPHIFNHLNERFPDRVGEHAHYNPLAECKRAYLDRTKLFIKLNYNLLRIITSSKTLNPQQRILWIGFYADCYKHYMIQARESFNLDKYGYSDNPGFSFITSYKELAEQYSCNTKYISKSVKSLEKLGFIKAQNIYLSSHYDDNKFDTSNEDYFGNALNKTQERQDKSLWRITLTLPDHYILELEKLKNRSSITPNDVEVTDNYEFSNTNQIEDCIVLGGVKFQLNSKQSTLLKSLIWSDHANFECSNNNTNSTNTPDTITSLDNESYIDSIIEELELTNDQGIEDSLSNSHKIGGSQFLTGTPNDSSIAPSLSIEALDRYCKKSNGIKSDPHVAKSGLLLNKDLKIKIKEYKSNLGASPKVIFNDFFKDFSNKDIYKKAFSKKKGKNKEFNIVSELIREKLKELPKDKADKARKFAYSLVSKGLATGYAAGLNKGELAKQLIYHAVSWKPTKLGSISRDKEIDTALTVAWKAVTNGTWQAPLELSKALVLEYEFRHHKQKYQKSGVISHELKTLEIDTEKLLGKWCDLDGKIKSSITFDFDQDKKDGEELGKPYDYLLLQDGDQDIKYIPRISQISTLDIKDTEDLQEFDKEFYRDHQVQNQSLYYLKDFECKDTLPKTSSCHHSFETELSESKEISNSVSYSVDLSRLSDSQKHIALRGSDTEIMEITTADNKQYFGKLKAIEVDENGELIMTFIPSSKKEFIKNKEIFSLSVNNTTSNLRIKETQDEVRGFKSLNEAVSGIFDKLLHIKSGGS